MRDPGKGLPAQYSGVYLTTCNDRDTNNNNKMTAFNTHSAKFVNLFTEQNSAKF